MNFIKVSPDGHGFVDSASNKPFVPFGANWFDPHAGWAPRIWSQFKPQVIERQFAQMSAAGLNCARVFLDFKTLAPQPRQYSGEGFAKVDQMIDIAGRNGVRLDFSGANTWEGTADYLRADEYADTRRLDFTCDLWNQLAERYGDDPRIMSWDLRNEPMVGFLSRDKGDWALPRLRLWQAHARRHLGIEVDDFPTWASADRELMREYVSFLESLADNWVRRQCDALRSSGARQLISVGSIQWIVPIHIGHWASYACFNPSRFSQYLDYTSVHFYPMLINARQSIAHELALQKAYVEIIARGAYVPGKPLVIEEFGWKGGKQPPKDSTGPWPQEEQSIWGDALLEVTSRVASGWLNWGYADTAAGNADISAASGLWTEDEQIKHWGRRFSDWAKRLQAEPPVYRAPQKTWKLNRIDYLAKYDGKPPMTALAELLANDPAESLGVDWE